MGIHNPPSGSINNNNIVSNSVNSITATTANVDAENNWWGTIDTQTINQTIYDLKIDPTLGTISFVPFLTQPSQQRQRFQPTRQLLLQYRQFYRPNTKRYSHNYNTDSTPVEIFPSFIYQVGSIFNLNTIDLPSQYV